jgi:hypothetical protein
MIIAVFTNARTRLSSPATKQGIATEVSAIDEPDVTSVKSPGQRHKSGVEATSFNRDSQHRAVHHTENGRRDRLRRPSACSLKLRTSGF